MSQPESVQPASKKNLSLLIRGSIWIAIGALIAAALVCVVWVLIGDQNGLIGRAFLTIVLLAAFAGIVILDAGLAPNRPDWLALASMVSWIVGLIVGLFKIWLPEDGMFFSAGERFFQLLLVIGILQLALLHVRLFTPAAARYVTPLTRTIYIATIVFLVGLVGMLVFYLTFPQSFDYPEIYWRVVVALTILAAVGTTLIPLLNALFAPKKDRSAAAPAYATAAVAPVPTSWPAYADGITPLPALPDGSPDWNAFYTGYPSVPQGYAAPQYAGQQYAGQQASALPVQANVPQPPAPQTSAPAAPAHAPAAPVAAAPPAPVAPPAPPVGEPASPAPAPPVPGSFPPAPPVPPQ